MAITPQQKFWEVGYITFSSTSVPKEILRIYGGESATIKMTNTGSESVYIGPDEKITTTRSYKMDNGETVSVGLDGKFGKDAFIAIWALPESTNDTLCYMKVIGYSPETEAT